MKPINAHYIENDLDSEWLWILGGLAQLEVLLRSHAEFIRRYGA